MFFDDGTTLSVNIKYVSVVVEIGFMHVFSTEAGLVPACGHRTCKTCTARLPGRVLNFSRHRSPEARYGARLSVTPDDVRDHYKLFEGCVNGVD